MSIVEEAPLNEPLRSGDIVRLPNGGVCLDGSFSPLQNDKIKYALVISRDCAGENGDAVLFAEVHPTRVDLQKLVRPENAGAKDLEKQLDDALEAFALARDGGTTPDRFYLGALDDDLHIRWAARFDRILHIEVPRAASARQAWTNEFRFRRLSSSFRQSLPTRLYWALCRSGFDDHDWFDTKDLSYVVQLGDAWIGELTKEAALAEANITAAAAAAEDSKKLDQLSKGRDAAVAKLERAKARVLRYREILQSR